MESLSSWAPQAKAHPPPPMAQAPKPTGVIIKSEFPSLRVCILPPASMMKAQCARFAARRQIGLRAQIISSPHFDELLDDLAVAEFLVEHFSCERGEFGIAGEA